MNYIVLTYSFYLAFTIGLTIWVARALFNNSKAFLSVIFHEEQALSDSVGRLLDVGFYLLAFGVALLVLTVTPGNYYDNLSGSLKEHPAAGAQQVIEILSHKIGAFVIILGVMLFLDLFILLLFRKRNLPKENKLGTYPPVTTGL